jgi:hypothetical protein
MNIIVVIIIKSLSFTFKMLKLSESGKLIPNQLHNVVQRHVRHISMY